MQRDGRTIGKTNPMRILPALIAAAALLAGCSEVGTEPTTAPTLTATSAELPPSTVTPEVQPLDTALPAGRYCYAGDDGITKIYVRMTVLDSGEVFGDTRIGVANVEEGYFTSATQRFDGNLAEDGRAPRRQRSATQSPEATPTATCSKREVASS